MPKEPRDPVAALRCVDFNDPASVASFRRRFTRGAGRGEAAPGLAHVTDAELRAAADVLTSIEAALMTGDPGAWARVEEARRVLEGRESDVTHYHRARDVVESALRLHREDPKSLSKRAGDGTNDTLAAHLLRTLAHYDPRF